MLVEKFFFNDKPKNRLCAVYAMIEFEKEGKSVKDVVYYSSIILYYVEGEK